MPLLRTKNDDSDVTLSLDIKYGLYGTTTIKIDGVNSPPIGGSFLNRPIGSNRYLKNKEVLITTTVMLSHGVTNTEVIFEINGDRDNDRSSSEVTAEPLDKSLTHFIDYQFI